MLANTKKIKALKRRLDGLYEAFDSSFLATDPLEFVHGYSSPLDREVAGLVSSSLAYGNVKMIRRSVGAALSLMGKSPGDFAASFRPGRHLRLFEGFKHRFTGQREMACLIHYAGTMIREAGSIGAFFMRGCSSSDANIKGALAAFTASVLALDHGAIYGAGRLPAKAGVRFFFPSPVDGSACKRLNLYLRWMVRRGDGLDFGIWKGVSPAQLVIPLDTHIARISANIGLTARKSADWKMAEEITASLALLDPKDPVKYDFALCRLGILDKCPKGRDEAKCAECLIREICVL